MKNNIVFEYVRLASEAGDFLYGLNKRPRIYLWIISKLMGYWVWRDLQDIQITSANINGDA